MREKKGFWELRDKQGRNTWAEEKYTSAQVLPTGGSFTPNVSSAKVALAISFFAKVSGRVSRQFGDFSLFCPGEPEEYLDRTYGPSWPHTGIISANQWCIAQGA